MGYIRVILALYWVLVGLYYGYIRVILGFIRVTLGLYWVLLGLFLLHFVNARPGRPSKDLQGGSLEPGSQLGMSKQDKPNT